VKVPTRMLDVHEEAFVAAPGSAAGDACAAGVLQIALSGCGDACGPVGIDRDGQRLVTLLTPAPKELAPIPKWGRPDYETPARSANREHASVPLGAGAHTIHVSSSCPLGVASQTFPPSIQVGGAGSTGGAAFDVQARDACETVSLAMVCR
jgi:hypothetical protein